MRLRSAPYLQRFVFLVLPFVTLMCEWSGKNSAISITFCHGFCGHASTSPKIVAPIYFWENYIRTIWLSVCGLCDFSPHGWQLDAQKPSLPDETLILNSICSYFVGKFIECRENLYWCHCVKFALRICQKSSIFKWLYLRWSFAWFLRLVRPSRNPVVNKIMAKQNLLSSWYVDI